MDDEIQLISDGDGLAVIGDQATIEEFFRSEGLATPSTTLDLRRLKTLFRIGADISQAVSDIAAESARWLKLTPESAHLRKKYGLTETSRPGVSYAMLGKPGSIRSWVQVEDVPGSLLSNPATLSGAAGIMAQVATQQAMVEITDYLARVDEKVDDILRKQDDAVVAQMVGTGRAIERAMTIREETQGVNEILWSTVDQAHQHIGVTQTYALDQLDTIAKKLESSRVGGLAKTTQEAESAVPRWLAVLARCFQLQDAIDVLELDRVLAESPGEVLAYRRGLKRHQEERRELISSHTRHLLDRMDVAVATANAKMIWTRTKSLDVVVSANHLAADVHDFHGPLGIESDLQSWDQRQLGPVAEVGSHAIQKTRDTAPAVVTGMGLAALGVLMKKALGEGTAEQD